ncbi:MAG TPA: CocE/NonD family hydrolase C-terminal non-catalytic domain-containing protein, partial [Pseudomonadales bacterium]|nr:CocE/NonD family hydrolase C-terminal non-catalytic domain-containing protein [Pseudomonadales bacterium]
SNPAPCYADDTDVEQQDNTLNFESAPFTAPYYINGPMQADVWIDSSVTEAVLSVRVDEVSADGSFVKPLSNGLLIASGRAVDESKSRFIKNEMVQPYHPFTQEAELPVVPGEVMQLRVEIFPTSALIQKGNKLRISIAPSNQSQGAMNDVRRARAMGGVTTVHIAKEYPSSVVLPIVPVSELN